MPKRACQYFSSDRKRRTRLALKTVPVCTVYSKLRTLRSQEHATTQILLSANLQCSTQIDTPPRMLETGTCLENLGNGDITKTCCWSQFLYPGTAVLRESMRCFCDTFAKSMFIFRGAHVGQQCPYGGLFTTCKITPNYHGSYLDSLVNMQLASRNPGNWLLITVDTSLQDLPGYPHQNAL